MFCGIIRYNKGKGKGKGAYSSSWNSPQNYGTPLVNGITQCYLPPDRCVRPIYHPNRTGWYSIYRPRKDERLSWPRWLVTYRNIWSAVCWSRHRLTIVLSLVYCPVNDIGSTLFEVSPEIRCSESDACSMLLWKPAITFHHLRTK